jgi:hypothetical protein
MSQTEGASGLGVNNRTIDHKSRSHAAPCILAHLSYIIAQRSARYARDENPPRSSLSQAEGP